MMISPLTFPYVALPLNVVKNVVFPLPLLPIMAVVYIGTHRNQLV